jgi:hypothetical protein
MNQFCLIDLLNKQCQPNGALPLESQSTKPPLCKRCGLLAFDKDQG